MLEAEFNNNKVYLKASAGYCIVIIKTTYLIDSKALNSIITSLLPFYEAGFTRFLVVINPEVKIDIKTVEDLTINSDHSKIEKISFLDYRLNFFDRIFINLLIKILYLKGSIKIKLFKTKKNAVKWLKK